MGGPTILMLQQLLAMDYFGWGSNANWVKSISGVSAVFNGSTATYFLGCDEETGLLPAESIGGILAAWIELSMMMTGNAFDRIYDLDLDHWGLTVTPGETLPELIARLANSPMFRGKDNAPYCLTVQAGLEQNEFCQTYPDTYYFSYVTEQTRESLLTKHQVPELLMNPVLIPTTHYIGSKVFDPPFYPGFNSSDWWANDGLVSTYSQMYPHISGSHPVGGKIEEQQEQFTPGQWWNQTLESTDHGDIAFLPDGPSIIKQRQFYTQLFERLASL